MSRPLRYSDPWQPVEMTSRTVQGRYLLKPSEYLNQIVAGILAIAGESFEVRIFNVVVLSNHIHLLVAGESPKMLSDFAGFVFGNIAREVGRLHDWPGIFWSRRHRAIPIVDDASLKGRMRYFFENGCKEGLVEHPAQWQGLNAVEALTKGRGIKGIWVNRTDLYNARRVGRKVREEAFTSHHELRLDPLPCWSDLPEKQQRALNAELVEAAAEATPKASPRKGYRAHKQVRPPHYRPKEVEQSRAPPCHAATERARELFMTAYKAFVNAYRAASRTLRDQLPSLGYPQHAQVLGFAISEAT